MTGLENLLWRHSRQKGLRMQALDIAATHAWREMGVSDCRLGVRLVWPQCHRRGHR